MSERIQRLNSLVQQEVAQILLREIEFPLDCLVTVTKATVADDAESAKVWISVMPAESGPSALAMIKKHIIEIQRLLNKRLVMKFVPKLTFVLDHQLIKLDSVTNILDSIAQEGEGAEPSTQSPPQNVNK